MKTRIFRSLVIILIFFVEWENVVVAAEINNTNVADVNEKALPSQYSDNKSYVSVEQEFKYYAPKSGFVYLVWKSDNNPPEEAVLWNNNTKLTDGLLYTPMVSDGDTFKIKLNVPTGITLQYYFWITKNKQGHYLDFWDLRSSGKTTVNDACPITKNAFYSKVVQKNESHVLAQGWKILLILVVLYFIIQLIAKRWGKLKGTPSLIEKLVFVGLSLALFQALARSEIIHINPIAVLFHPGLLVKIIRGSWDDFLYVGSLIIVFVMILLLLRNLRVRKLTYYIFLFFAIFSTLVAFLNITTVAYLGKPFTYQWLYYSDFLGSNDAKTALQENLSLSIAGNLIAFCLSTFILSNVLREVYRLLVIQVRFKYIIYLVFGLGLIVLSVQVFKTKVTWTKGQSENAITAMVYSIFTANSNSSFFSARIPTNMEPFDPAKSTRLETSSNPVKNSEVKNVLFIVLESAGACYFDGYGGTYQLSPNLNRYACQSLIFDQMYAHAPATNRSLVSILGSLYPFLSYKSLTQEAPELDHPTLSSVLKDRGYRTSFFSSADLRFQNCRQFLAHRGFDRIEDFSAIKCSEEFQLESADYNEGNGIDDICLADRLTSWLDEDATQNFFSMIWTVQGHYPYFFAKEEEDFGVSNYNFNRYLNCLKHNDELVGRVMQALEDRGLTSSTLVVVFGDHGEAFGQHQQYGHGTALYEENLKVPLYFINSQLFHGEHKSDIGGMKDLATTVLSVVDADIPKQWQGRDLLNTNSDEAFFFAPWSDYLFGYRKGNMKYIFNESRNSVEIYDLSKDPNEKTNLFQPGMKDAIAEARNRVAAWVQFQDKFIQQIYRGKP